MSVELQIERMTVEEKLRVMEALWDDLCRQEAQVPVEQWQKDLLDERERSVAGNKSGFMDWETAKKQISARTA